jgi:hypothetical protein
MICVLRASATYRGVSRNIISLRTVESPKKLQLGKNGSSKVVYKSWPITNASCLPNVTNL